ncbi:MAG: GNAT family N-acetyltransferase [Ferruginibacter sp.]
MTNSAIDIQPLLQDSLVIARPLHSSDFEQLYHAASDPLIWEQHPNRNRWQLKDFENYFAGAIQSGGALLVSDANTREVIGSSRYSDYKPGSNSISIGYTFFKRSHWGRGYNYALKRLMLEHIFQYVDAVTFYIGAVNKRSQISIERFGAIKTGEAETAYFGEAAKLDYIYTISREEWKTMNPQKL